MTGPQEFDATLRSWLRRAAPAEAPDRVLAGALTRVADEAQQTGWLASISRGPRRRVILRGAALTGVIVLAILAGMRLASLGLDVGESPSPVPSPSSSAEASVGPSEAALVVCGAVAVGGPMDDIDFGLNVLRYPDNWPDVLIDGANGLRALADRASGDEREDLRALAAAVDDFSTAWREVTWYSYEESQALPQEVKDAAESAAQRAQDAAEVLQAAEPAFYLKYAERCGLDLDTPHFVDCGPNDQATCDRAVAAFIAGRRQTREDGSYVEGQGPPPSLPILGYVIGEVFPSGCIPDQAIYWPGGGIISQSMCGDFGDASPPPTPTAIVGSPEVGVPYQVALHDCMVDFSLGDTWWRFENAGPTPGPIIPDTVGTVHAVVTLTSPDTAILRIVDGSELMLLRVDDPIEGRCY